jgi:hypothetical protein
MQYGKIFRIRSFDIITVLNILLLTQSVVLGYSSSVYVSPGHITMESVNQGFGRGRWVIGISLQGGIAVVGKDLERKQEDWGSFAFTNQIYRSSGCEATLAYWFDREGGFSFGIGTLRASLSGRNSNLSKLNYPNEEPWVSSPTDWKLSILPISAGLTGQAKVKNDVVVSNINIEYYLANGNVFSAFRRYNHQRGEDDYELVVGSFKGRGIGVSGSLGWKVAIKDGLSWHLSGVVRMGEIWETSYVVTPSDVLWSPVSIGVTGLNAKIGLLQSF